MIDILNCPPETECPMAGRVTPAKQPRGNYRNSCRSRNAHRQECLAD
ncbi:hypothetical protein [Mesorhizobium sp. CN2-181]